MTRQGRRIFWVFIAGIAASATMGAVLAQTMETWLWVTVTVLGLAISAIWYIITARSHTDYSTTYNEYVKDKKNA